MTITVKLNTDRKSPSCLYPIVIQLIIDRRRALVYTGVKVHFDEFDTVKKRVCYVKGISRSYKEVAGQNRQIRCVREEVEAQLAEFVQKGIAFTAKEIAGYYRLRTSQDTLYGLFEKMIREKYACGKIGGARAYESTYRKIRLLTENKNIQINNLRPFFIEELYRKMLNTPVSINTISFYMRNLRAVINNSGRGNANLSRKLFCGIVLRKEKTVKRALGVEEMRTLVQFNPQENERLALAKDLFMLCFLLRGVALVDIFFMRKECLHGNYIRYRRHKTSVSLCVGLTNESSLLIECYRSKDPQSPYLFYFLDGFNEENAAYVAYRTALRQQNRSLKIIGKKLGLSIPLTSYVVRHTWATQAKASGAPLEHISEAMGHTSQKTTVIYLKSFNQSVLDKLNSKVFEPYQGLFPGSSQVSQV